MLRIKLFLRVVGCTPAPPVHPWKLNFCDPKSSITEQNTNVKYNGFMRVFIGVPLLHLYGESFLRLSFCEGFKRNLRLSHIEPHLTLKAPQDIDEGQLPTWKHRVQKALQGFKPVHTKIDSSFFITPVTLALRGESKPLCPIHVALVDNLSEFDSAGVTYHEGKDFIAHVTVGRATRRLEQSDRKMLTAECDQIIKPQEITVNKVRLYIRRDIEQGYEALEDIKLNGS